MDPRAKGKPIDWIGSSREDLRSFPGEVQQAFGFGLYRVQMGEMPPSAKPFQGALSGVYELRESHEGSAYRAVYIAKLKEKIYVLHCFQKKSKRGIETPSKELDLIAQRLKLAIADSKGTTP